MRITADTNLLIRAIVDDDPVQAATARRILAEADHVAVTLPALCELVRVLMRAFGIGRAEIGRVIAALTSAGNVIVDVAAVEAGPTILAAGGDFADGVIAYPGRLQGGDIFMSFDGRAVALLDRLGERAEVPQ